MNDDKDVKEEIVLPEEPSALKQTTEEVSQETETEESGKGANQRIRELNQAKKEAEVEAQQAKEEVKSLRDRLSEISKPSGLSEQQVPQTEEIVKPGEEMDANEFQKRVLQQADARAELKVRQSEAVGRINSEAKDVLMKYPELDPDSESFNKELSESVTESVEAQVRVNPYSASVTKIVDKLMKPYRGAVDQGVGQATENIAKQVSGAALRPTSVRQPEKNAKDKTMAELEQELGIVNA